MGGRTGTRARSASAPWPISRRPGAAQRAHFADGVGREVVEVHVLLLLVHFQVVHDLRFAGRAQRQARQHLRLTAREQAGAVYAGQQADFAGNRANLVQLAAVGANAFFDDEGADLAS